MSNKNTLELTKIEGLGLNSVNYGEDLNVRLNNIEDNFKKITQFDYIKGAPGDSYGSRTIKLNKGDDLTTTIAGIIDCDAENIEGRELVVFYKIVNNTEIITSILPFVYQDPSYAELVSMTDDDKEKFQDKSCVVLYNPDPEDPEKGFFKTQTNPTIYYNTEVGAFCWKIGETLTNLICQGPKGEDGITGNLYIAKVEKDENETNPNRWKIKSILYVAGNEIVSVAAPVEDTVEDTVEDDADNFHKIFKNIQVGTPILCIKEKDIYARNENGEIIENENNEPIIKYTDIETFMSPVQIDGSNYYVSDLYGCFHFDKIEDLEALKTLLYHVGVTPGLLKGLFVPVVVDGKVSDDHGAHMIWDSSKSDQDKIVNIGIVKDVTDPVPVEGGEGVFNINYKTTNFNDVNVDNLTVKGSNLGQRFAKILRLNVDSYKAPNKEGIETYYYAKHTIDSNQFDGDIAPYSCVINESSIKSTASNQQSAQSTQNEPQPVTYGTTSYDSGNNENDIYAKVKISASFRINGITDELANVKKIRFYINSIGYPDVTSASGYKWEIKLDNDYVDIDISPDAPSDSSWEYSDQTLTINEYTFTGSLYCWDGNGNIITPNQNANHNLPAYPRITVRITPYMYYEKMESGGSEGTVQTQTQFVRYGVVIYDRPVVAKESDGVLKYEWNRIDCDYITPPNFVVNPDESQTLNYFRICFENYKPVGENNHIWNKKIEIHNQSNRDLKIELYAQEMDEKGDISKEGLLNYFNKNTDKTREALICKGESHLILSIFDAERDDKKNTNGDTNNSFDPTDEFLYTRYMVAQRTQVASPGSNQPFEIMYDFYNIP